MAPLYAAARAAKGTVFEARANELLIDAIDRIASTLISRCDVFIGMSGMCLHTIQAVRRKYQTKIFVERGSRHIVSQREILENIPGRKGSAPSISEWSVRREIAEYELADTISFRRSTLSRASRSVVYRSLGSSGIPTAWTLICFLLPRLPLLKYALRSSWRVHGLFGKVATFWWMRGGVCVTSG